ncbi:MAG: alpha/beta hydrolase [Candidatus Abawacabacteria bacterium]|nr:alpha/beta hydrolase [Candidatus Abawacabacteria bacterium]
MQVNSYNCIIIHGCPSDKEKAMNPETRTYDKHWIPWTKRQLTALGIPTETPLMPNPWSPDYDEFKKVFEQISISENTILIGHSCGCTFLVRWLGETKRSIKKLILVAPWKIRPESDPLEIAFYTHPIDQSISSRVTNIIMFTADNEAEDGKKGLTMFHQILGGEVINLVGKGHYTLTDMGTEVFPELCRRESLKATL